MSIKRSLSNSGDENSNLKLSIIFVTYNSGNVIIDAIKSCYAPEFEIIIIDNNSIDDTIAKIRKNFPENHYPNVKLIKNHQNIGFGRANNKAIELASNDIILLLNPDVIMMPEQINELYQYIKIADIVAPNVIHPDSMESQQRIDGRKKFDDKNLTNEEVANGYLMIDWLIGACMMFDRRIAPRFDEQFFLYYEDDDFCKMAQSLALIFNIEVKHNSGNSTSNSDSEEMIYFKAWHYAWSKCYYFQKHNIKFNYNRYLLRNQIYELPFIGSDTRKIKSQAQNAAIKHFINGGSAFDFTDIAQLKFKETKKEPLS